MANYSDILVCTYYSYYLLPRQVVTINMPFLIIGATEWMKYYTIPSL